MTKKILYISGTRADYGLMRFVLRKIDNNPEFDLLIGASGMHLMPEFGNTIDEICNDGFHIVKINASHEHDDRESMARFIGKFIIIFTKIVKDFDPDFILILGDRAEMLGGAIVGTYLNIPIIHIHGGEVSSTVDEPVRHAITKLAHVHLAATQKSVERIIRLGENPKNVYLVGAPGLDEMVNGKCVNPEILSRKYHLDLTDPLLLVLQHPVSGELDMAQAQIRQTMDALVDLQYPSLVIYPNADPGGRQIIEVIQSYWKYPHIKIFKSIPHNEYLSLLKISAVLIGNSSSGIIEAASFRIPVVNIGSRQLNREYTTNVIHVGYEKDEIKNAIKMAIHDKDFIKKVKNCRNPYGEGNSSDKIIDILSKIKIDPDLLQKKLMY